MKILKVLIFVFGLSIFVNAQTAVLKGRVFDASGALIPNARIEAIDEKGERFETLTKDDGTYRLSLPFTELASTSSKISKFDISVDLQSRGFEKFLLKDFNFVSAFSGEMFLDIALNSKNPEPCGYSGAGCLTKDTVVEPRLMKTSDKILQKPSSKKAKNYKRKNNK